MTRTTDYGSMCVVKWRDGERPREIAPGHVALHDGDVMNYVYDTLGDLAAWRDWARGVFESDTPIAIVGSGNSYSVKEMPADEMDKLAEMVEAGDDRAYSAAVDAWVKRAEGQ